MTVRLTLGPLWHRSGRVHARGWGVGADGRVHVGAALAEHLGALPDEAAFAAATEALDGDWAAVWTDAAGATAAVDRVRSIPLFYGQTDGAFVLSDDARHVAHVTGARVDDPVVAAEWMLTGVVTGPETLATGVFQVQAGERVRLDARGAHAARPFLYGAGAGVEGGEDDLVERGARLIEASFEASLESVRGRPLVIPLSGGMDSRLVAALLVRAGRTDAVCFSYGEAWRFEATASRTVARALGLPWHFVRYSSPRWDRWYRMPAYQAFRRAGTGLTGVEHGQDWPAIHELRRRGVVAPGAVVLPGHTGDFLAGTHLPPPAALAGPTAGVWERYFVEWRTPALPGALAEALRARIAATARGAATPAEAATRWDWQERQAKMVVNSVRSYEGHGLDWRLPLWSSRAVLDFWGGLPLALRADGRLYRRVLRRLMGDTLFDLPATPRRGRGLVNRIERLSDFGMGRYGMWLGPTPRLRSVRVRVRDLVHVRAPDVARAVEAVIAPVAGTSPVWIPINGLLALGQLNDLATGEPVAETDAAGASE